MKNILENNNEWEGQTREVLGRSPLLSGILGFLRSPALLFLQMVEDLGRILVLPLLLYGAAILPLSWITAVCRAAGLLLSLIPPNGRSSRYAERAALYGISPAPCGLEKFHITTPMSDFLTFRRHILGKEFLYPKNFHEKNPELVADLRTNQTPFIIATGHFSRPAAIALYTPKVNPGKMSAILARVPEWSLNPGKLWNRLHFGQMVRVVHQCRPDINIINSNQVGKLKSLLKNLREPGNILLTPVDTCWQDTPKRTLVRPFCGSARSSFATGTAFLARKAQCPIVVAVPYMNEKGELVIDWRKRIAPPAQNDDEADLKITDLMLNEIEQAVFERPSQYVFDVLR